MVWNACCAARPQFAARPLWPCGYRQIQWSLFLVFVAVSLTFFKHVGRVHVMRVAAAVTVFKQVAPQACEYVARKAREEARAT